MTFLVDNKILSKNQFGFQNGKSTNDAISLLLNKITNSLDSSRPCAAIFVDLAKAFDTVSHKILFSKLEDVGIRGQALQLIKSYLQTRVQKVQINQKLSLEKQVKYGVPQGTVMGPILFILYLNQLLMQKYKGTVISFADDTVLFVEGNSWTEVQENISSDLTTITKWFDKNLLTINLKKTKYLPFSNNKTRLPRDPTIEIFLPFRKNKTWSLQRTDQAEYLGIILDNHLKWDYQIQMLTKRIRSLLYIFKNIRKIIDLQNLRKIYFALVQSLLSYGIIAWGAAYDNVLNPLIVAQKRIIKLIYKLNIRYPSNLLFKHCNFLSVRNLYYKDATMQSIKYGALADNDVIVYHTRYKENQNLILPRLNRAIGQRSFLYLGQKMYNLLPQHLKNIIHNKKFKKKMSEWLIEHSPKIL